MLAMQNRDGGWGAFDRDNDHEFLCHVPFADHNAMIDPSTPDLTGRVLEMLGQLGRRVGDPAVDRAVAYLRRTQEADGSWFGRWGVNYIYGTWQALVGLAAVACRPTIRRSSAGANWLLAYQQPCGGWGESPDSYAQPHLRGQGPVDRLANGLGRAGADGRRPCARHPAVTRGIHYLLDTQRDDGTWDETGVHRHRLPAGVLPALSLLPDLLPAVGPGRNGPWRPATERARRGGARSVAERLPGRVRLRRDCLTTRLAPRCSGESACAFRFR